MKDFSTLFLCLFLAASLSGQEIDVSFANIACDDTDGAEQLSFDLTLTLDGSPIEIAQSGIQIINARDNNVFNSTSASGTSTGLSYVETDLTSDFVCDHLVGRSVEFILNPENNAVSDNSISTEVIFAPEAEISFANIECIDHTSPGARDGSITFDLELTVDGTPVDITTTGISIVSVDNRDFLAGTNFAKTYMETDGVYFGLEHILSTDNSCSDLVDQVVVVEDNESRAQFAPKTVRLTDAAPIPTMGQWALMILGLLMASLGVVAIKRKALARV